MLTIDRADLVNKSPGVYSFAQASRILARSGTSSVATVRSWWKSGLVHDNEPGDLLTFHDLVSLELVRRFRAAGVPLQKVRKLEVALRQRQPMFSRPFAHNTFFTDGAAIWAEANGATEEIIGQQQNHLVFAEAIATFATEITYRHDVAVGWDLSQLVEVDPLVSFGQPVIRGTRIPVETVLANLESGSKEEVADMYGISVLQVNGAIEFASVA